MLYSIKKTTYLEVYREEGNTAIFYSPETDMFYRYFRYVENAPKYKFIYLNIIFINIGYWLNSYWQEVVSTVPFMKVLFFLCGAGVIYIGFVYAEKRTEKESWRRMTERCIITDAIIKNGKRWMKIQCMILVIAYSASFLVGYVFFVWNHIIWGLLFYMMMIVVGILTGAVHPVARYKLYKKWAKEIKMQAIVKGTDVD